MEESASGLCKARGTWLALAVLGSAGSAVMHLQCWDPQVAGASIAMGKEDATEDNSQHGMGHPSPRGSTS
eukprot:7679567-Pyramimonas_sp.AAC.1